MIQNTVSTVTTDKKIKALQIDVSVLKNNIQTKRNTSMRLLLTT